jgi:predicted alpha/beta-fold hydrolase
MSPNFLLKNGVFNTVYSSSPLRSLHQSKKVKALNAASEKKVFQSSAGVNLEYFKTTDAAKSVIFLPGFLGNKDSKYLACHAFNAFRAGYQILRIHPVDHGGSEHLNSDFFKATDISAIVELVKTILSNQPDVSFNLIGFSLGGNIALRISQALSENNLERVIAISPVLDPAQAMKAMDTQSVIINKYFLRKWKKSIANKHKHYPDNDLLAALELKSLREITEFFRNKNAEFFSLGELFHAYAITDENLKNLPRNTTIWSAMDDPCIPVDPLLDIQPSKLLDLNITKYGGHCGFIENFSFQSQLEDWILQKLQSNTH